MNKIFSFIICTNSEMYYKECVHYIEKLQVPDGWQIEIIEVNDAKSMTAGYNEGMEAANGDIKIYMHQDVFILYPFFLYAIHHIFESDKKIGLIGMVGATELSKDGVMWHNPEIGNLYGIEEDGLGELTNLEVDGSEVSAKHAEEVDVYTRYQYDISDGYTDVKTIDGLLMVSFKDLPWREDIFDGWDFYDVSQSLEMLKAGYRVVVPNQKYPWVLHDDGILNLKNYDKYRRICMNEYKEFWE